MERRTDGQILVYTTLTAEAGGPIKVVKHFAKLAGLQIEVFSSECCKIC